MSTLFLLSWFISGIWMLSVGANVHEQGIAARFASVLGFLMFTGAAVILYSTGTIHTV